MICISHFFIPNFIFVSDEANELFGGAQIPHYDYSPKPKFSNKCTRMPDSTIHSHRIVPNDETENQVIEENRPATNYAPEPTL